MANFGVLAVLACILALATGQTITVHPGLAVSGKVYIQHVTPSLVSGAGGTAPGGGGRRLLEAHGRSLLQNNASTTAAEAAGTTTAVNSVLATNFGRKLLQTTNGLEVVYVAKKDIITGRVTVVLEFPATAGNAVILAAATTQQPTGAIVSPATFFNAEIALGGAVAVSKTGFVATAGGVVRVRLTFDLVGETLPALQFSWQYASNLPAPNQPFFFLNADQITIIVDKAGLPTFKGIIDTLP